MSQSQVPDGRFRMGTAVRCEQAHQQQSTRFCHPRRQIGRRKTVVQSDDLRKATRGPLWSAVMPGASAGKPSQAAAKRDCRRG